MATIKITELTSIGANLTSSTVIPVVNMSGTPTTEKTLLGNIANVVLAGAGGNYTAAAISILAQSVTNAAQPNITSTGTLTNLTVSGNVAVNGNITGNGTAYVGNLSTTGIASITTLSVGATANLGAVGNVTITGGTAGQVLSTDGAGNLSWASDSTTYSNSNVAAYLPTYTGNIGADIVTANLFVGSGANLTSIAGANVSGFVPNANVANTAFAVAAANVSGLGNIATINLDGSTSNVLYGNGAFAAVPATAPAGSNGEIQFNISGAFESTGNLTFVDGISGGTLEIGPPGAMQLDGNGTIVASSLESTSDVYIYAANGIVDLRATGNIVLKSDNANYEWVFGDDSVLTLPGEGVIRSNDDTVIIQSYDTANAISKGIRLGTNGSLYFEDDGNAWLTIDNVSNNAVLTAAANSYVRIASNNGSENWYFESDGNLTLSGNTVAINFANGTPAFGNIVSVNLDGNVSNALIGDGTFGAVAIKETGNWTLASGVNTVSISVPVNGTYAIWINGNIPNGIVTYTATAVVTNTNVPVLGEQYGWFYELGNALVLTSIPDQFVGTQGAISNATPYLGNTANVFTFGITNNSGSSQVVDWGYTKL